MSKGLSTTESLLLHPALILFRSSWWSAPLSHCGAWAAALECGYACGSAIRQSSRKGSAVSIASLDELICDAFKCVSACSDPAAWEQHWWRPNCTVCRVARAASGLLGNHAIRELRSFCEHGGKDQNVRSMLAKVGCPSKSVEEYSAQVVAAADGFAQAILAATTLNRGLSVDKPNPALIASFAADATFSMRSFQQAWPLGGEEISNSLLENVISDAVFCERVTPFLQNTFDEATKTVFNRGRTTIPAWLAYWRLMGHIIPHAVDRGLAEPGQHDWIRLVGVQKRKGVIMWTRVAPVAEGGRGVYVDPVSVGLTAIHKSTLTPLKELHHLGQGGMRIEWDLQQPPVSAEAFGVPWIDDKSGNALFWSLTKSAARNAFDPMCTVSADLDNDGKRVNGIGASVLQKAEACVGEGITRFVISRDDAKHLNTKWRRDHPDITIVEVSSRRELRDVIDRSNAERSPVYAHEPTRPCEFYGRDQCREDIVAHLENERHVDLLASPRMGTTSVLRAVHRQLRRRHGYRTVLVEPNHDSTSPQHFTAKLITSFLQHSPTAGECWSAMRAYFPDTLRLVTRMTDAVFDSLAMDLREKSWMHAAELAFNAIGSDGEPTILTVDDSPLFYDTTDDRGRPGVRSSQLYEWLSERLRNLRSHVTTLIASAPMKRSSNATDASIVPYPMECWTRDEVVGFLRAVCRRTKTQMSENEMEYFADRIGWLLPEHIQAVFRQVHWQVRDTRAATAKEIDIAYDKLTSRNADGAATFGRLKRRLRWYFRKCQIERTEQLIGIAAKQRWFTVDDSFNGTDLAIAQTLIELGYLKESTANIFEVRSPLFRDWWKNVYPHVYLSDVHE